MSSKHGALLSAVHCSLYGAELARNWFDQKHASNTVGYFVKGLRNVTQRMGLIMATSACTMSGNENK